MTDHNCLLSSSDCDFVRSLSLRDRTGLFLCLFPILVRLVLSPHTDCNSLYRIEIFLVRDHRHKASSALASHRIKAALPRTPLFAAGVCLDLLTAVDWSCEP